jgi:hypothetical protein
MNDTPVGTGRHSSGFSHSFVNTGLKPGCPGRASLEVRRCGNPAEEGELKYANQTRGAAGSSL